MFSWMIRTIASRLSYNEKASKLSILTYHRVSEFYDEKNPKTIHLSLFKLQMQWLKKHFVVLPLPEALDLQQKNALPRRAVCITIDDGYRDSYELIFKTLQEEKIKATFFISTQGIVDGGLWDAEVYSAIFDAPKTVMEINCGGRFFDLSCFEERVNTRYLLTEYTKYLPLSERKIILDELKRQTSSSSNEKYFLTIEQIKEMHSAGMTIGAHTENHPILTKESDNVAWQEIKQSKELLEAIIDAPVEYFAYPNGKLEEDFNEKHMSMVEDSGFKAALSTDWGVLADLSLDRFKIKRFTPWDEKELHFILRLALNYRSH